MKVALFDMDGTLVDSMGVWEYAPAGALKKLGIEPDEEAFNVFREKGYSETAKYLVKKYSLEISDHEFMTLMDETVIPFYHNDVQLKEGALEYLQLLQDKGVRICLLSANNIELVNIIRERFELDKYIRDFISTSNFGNTKAEPEIFVKLAMLYGVKVTDCVLFEDSKYAIKTAKSVSMKTVGIKDAFSKKDEAYMQENCTRFISSFNELIADDVF